MEQPLKVTYKSTNVPYTAIQWLRSLPDKIACDFEAALKYTPEELTQYKLELSESLSKPRTAQLRSILAATALDHPSHVDLTHVSIAISPTEAIVIILDTPKITQLVLNFLVTTDKLQIWHNASFDFKHIYYHTNKFPLNYEDTQLRAKCILNNTDNQASLTGLKHLAGHKYGDWAISADNFDKSQMHEEHVLHYAAIDACATYWLYDSIDKVVENEVI